jgi:hypothetical protein
MLIPQEFTEFANDLARAMVADTMDSFSPEEIRQWIEELEAKLRKLP